MKTLQDGSVDLAYVLNVHRHHINHFLPPSPVMQLFFGAETQHCLQITIRKLVVVCSAAGSCSEL